MDMGSSIDDLVKHAKNTVIMKNTTMPTTNITVNDITYGKKGGGKRERRFFCKNNKNYKGAVCCLFADVAASSCQLTHSL